MVDPGTEKPPADAEGAIAPVLPSDGEPIVERGRPPMPATQDQSRRAGDGPPPVTAHGPVGEPSAHVTEGGAAAPAPPGGRGRTGARRYVMAGLMFVLGSTSIGVAIAILPSGSQVAADGGVNSIQVTAAWTPSLIAVSEAPEGDGVGLALTIRPPAGGTPAVARELPGAVFTVPVSSWGGHQCGRALTCQRGSSLATLVVVKNSPSDWTWRPAGGGSWFFKTVIPGTGSSVDFDKEYLSILQPSVSFTVGGTAEEVPVALTVVIPGIDTTAYHWSEVPLVSKDSLSWVTRSNRTTATTEITGISYEVQDQNSTLTFVAGALLGIAGAALIAVVQELVRGSPGYGRRGGR